MLAMYNVLNSTGLPRGLVKVLSKAMLIFTLALPIYAAWQIGMMSNSEIVIPNWTRDYARTMWIVGTGLMVRWIFTRPGLESSEIAATRDIEAVDVSKRVDHRLTKTAKCHWLSKIPGNQILDLSIERIELSTRGLPEAIDGLKIAHLSDIHLTGHIDPAIARTAVEYANDFQPDVFALTGDIVDHKDCLAWLPQIFGDASAKQGRYFILGNHDKRHGNTDAVRAGMGQLGWVDLGGRSVDLTLAGVPCEMIGNEYPWYPKADIPQHSDAFRVLLSHSPDQIGWARDHGVGLMLAGHTHGGQGRLPLIGPLIAPSRYGTRFASGDFYLEPTTMHVTRGLSGTHLLRLNCPPEVSLITLRCSE